MANPTGTAAPDQSSRIVTLGDEQFYIGESLWRTALRRLQRDKLTIIALVIIALLTLSTGVALADPDLKLKGQA